MSRSAGCDCGALKVTCSAEPKLISLCHCLACQRRTGSPFGIAAFFNRSDVLVEGACTAYESLRERISGAVSFLPEMRLDRILGAAAQTGYDRGGRRLLRRSELPSAHAGGECAVQT
jgi:hypothetical protein